MPKFLTPEQEEIVLASTDRSTPRGRRNAPHTYTEQKIELLMGQAAQRHSGTGMRAQTYSTLIGLLVATGLRPGEAIRLDRSDVNLVNGILSIRESKFGKSSFVPVEESTRVILEHYSRYRDPLFSLRLSEAFLVGESGKRLNACSTRRMFVRISRAVGLRATRQDGRDGRGPRLQDFRHSFATGRLVQWYSAGLDVSRELPKLATYLGHVDVGVTYWYIEAVPELLQLAAKYLDGDRPGDQVANEDEVFVGDGAVAIDQVANEDEVFVGDGAVAITQWFGHVPQRMRNRSRT